MRYRFIGDTLLSVPFLRNLRARFPEARIDVLVAPGSGEVLQHCPYIDELIYFDTSSYHRYENKAGAKKKSFWYYVQELRQRNYDTTFILKRSFSSALLAFLSGIKQRIGFNTDYRSLLLTHKMPYEMTSHESECYLDNLRAVDIEVKDTHLEAFFSKEDEDNATKLFSSLDLAAANNVLIHLTSANKSKLWTKEESVALIKWLINEKKVNLFSLGAPSDIERYQPVLNELSEAERKKWHILCGKTSLLESFAFLKKMDLVLGVDSGTMHMAAAAGVKTLTLFGPMDINKWKPLGSENQIVKSDLECQPCNLKFKCPYEFECMKSIELAQVQAEYENMLG